MLAVALLCLYGITVRLRQPIALRAAPPERNRARPGMSVIVISACIGILYLAGLVGLAIARAPFGRAVIYGVSFTACAAILLSSCVAIGGGAAALVVPLGVPWVG